MDARARWQTWIPHPGRARGSNTGTDLWVVRGPRTVHERHLQAHDAVLLQAVLQQRLQ